MVKNTVAGCVLVALIFMGYLAFYQKHEGCWRGHSLKKTPASTVDHSTWSHKACVPSSIFVAAFRIPLPKKEVRPGRAGQVGFAITGAVQHEGRPL
jgi:hypothetical protein